jgi:hypothetical protein
MGAFVSLIQFARIDVLIELEKENWRNSRHEKERGNQLDVPELEVYVATGHQLAATDVHDEHYFYHFALVAQRQLR